LAQGSPKQLELIFLLDVAGDEMADSFRNVLRKTIRAGVCEEIKALTVCCKKARSEKRSVWITTSQSWPAMAAAKAKEEVLIACRVFQGVWNNYFGRTTAASGEARRWYGN